MFAHTAEVLQLGATDWSSPMPIGCWDMADPGGNDGTQCAGRPRQTAPEFRSFHCCMCSGSCGVKHMRIHQMTFSASLMPICVTSSQFCSFSLASPFKFFVFLIRGTLQTTALNMIRHLHTCMQHQYVFLTCLLYGTQLFYARRRIMNNKAAHCQCSTRNPVKMNNLLFCVVNHRTESTQKPLR